MLLKGFLSDKFSIDESLGSFTADMKAAISVTAPLFSYGVSENHTLAIAVPYYRAKTSIELGFAMTRNAQSFVDQLNDEKYNLTQSARTVARKLNNAVLGLQQKLADNGFEALTDWEANGVGDTTVASKYRIINNDIIKVATTNGVVAPTGRTSNPDNLIDIPFGDGCWKGFSSIIIDEQINSELFLNQFIKYTHQTKASREIRLATMQESIEVEKENVSYSLGDIINLGMSVQIESKKGIVSGIGYNFHKKFSDRYFIENKDVVAKLQSDTEQIANHLEIKFGYSTIPMFKQKKFAAPIIASLDYQKQISGRNTPVKDLLTLDFAMFF